MLDFEYKQIKGVIYDILHFIYDYKLLICSIKIPFYPRSLTK